MKKLLIGFAFGVVASTSISIVASEVIQRAEFNNVRVRFNGHQLVLSENILSVQTQGSENIVNYMPVRAVLEGMGYTVNWNGQEQIIEITGGSASQGATENQELELSSNINNNSAREDITLSSGTFTVGQDISTGRYVVTGDGRGNFTVHGSAGLRVNEILRTKDSDSNFGVPSITTDLEDGDRIEIRGINNVTFRSVQRSLSNTLTTGNWIVGEDISAGTYDVTVSQGETGNFIILLDSRPVVNEILSNTPSGFGVETVRVNLQDGQLITISGISEVYFN